MRYCIVTIVLALVGCGRYLPPVTPESLAPAAVDAATIQGDDKGVLTISWMAPHNDLRGKKLDEMKGYSVDRWINNKPFAIIDDLRSIQFTEVTFIEDHHIEELQKLEEAAEERGQISRKIKVDEALKKFTYTDTAVPQGTSFYKITPVNVKGGEGKVKDLYKVTRAGDLLTIVTLPYTLDVDSDT